MGFVMQAIRGYQIRARSDCYLRSQGHFEETPAAVSGFFHGALGMIFRGGILLKALHKRSALKLA